MDWRHSNGIDTFTEDVLLKYFRMAAENHSPGTLWAMFSMLKSTLKAFHKVDIQNYHKLKVFLKKKNAGFKPKTTKVLSKEEIIRFVTDAPDSQYLLEKVALIVGISGGCRICELVAMKMEDIRDMGSVFVVKIIDSMTNRERTFTVAGTFYGYMKKYVALRPLGANPRFFVNYQNRRCTKQPVGVNKLAKFPFKIAAYLGLSEPEAYKGHCFRRSSSSVKFDCSEDLVRLIRLQSEMSSNLGQKTEFPEFFSCK